MQVASSPRRPSPTDSAVLFSRSDFTGRGINEKRGVVELALSVRVSAMKLSFFVSSRSAPPPLQNTKWKRLSAVVGSMLRARLRKGRAVLALDPSRRSEVREGRSRPADGPASCQIYSDACCFSFTRCRLRRRRTVRVRRLGMSQSPAARPF
jgi:hypothetical protein